MAFTKHLIEKGTEQKLTVHDTPEQNGVAEVLNRIGLERTRAILHASGLPKYMWGEALRHVIWLKNRTSTVAVASKTPFEAVTGKKPNLAKLPEWGCVAWVHTKKNSKLDGRATEGRWVGFDEQSKGHRIFWPDKRSVTVEHSVVFTELLVSLRGRIPLVTLLSSQHQLPLKLIHIRMTNLQHHLKWHLYLYLRHHVFSAFANLHGRYVIFNLLVPRLVLQIVAQSRRVCRCL